MSYNRWNSSSYDLELYHHGVKGMKWGKHLFGKGAGMPQGAGGVGGGLEDDELNVALDQFKRGEITQEQLDAVYKKIQSFPYRLAHNPGETLNDLAGKTIHAVSDGVDALKRPDEVASHAIHKGRAIIDRFKSADIKGAAAKQTGRGVSTAVKRLSAPTVIASENTRAKVERDKKERAWEAYKRSNADRRHAEYVDELKAKHRARKEREKHQQAMDQLAEDRRKYNEKNRPANLPRSRRRKISQNGTGVHLTTPIGKRKRWP